VTTSGEYSIDLDGASSLPGGQIVAGYLVGCAVNISNGISIGVPPNSPPPPGGSGPRPGGFAPRGPGVTPIALPHSARRAVNSAGAFRDNEGELTR
ncbi:MspA family porin, partial [Nocardia asiatica]|uniref:MspA family porin n=1 Tax=Nocardia asiatica TaxID=209252 RepID=UPI003CC7EE0E